MQIVSTEGMECQILLTICMKCKNLLSEKNEKTKQKNFKMLSAENFTQST